MTRWYISTKQLTFCTSAQWANSSLYDYAPCKMLMQQVDGPKPSEQCRGNILRLKWQWFSHKIPSDFLTKYDFLWTLNFRALGPEFLGMFAHMHCSSKGVPSTCWNYYTWSPDIAEIPGACSRCVIKSLVTAVAILFNKFFFKLWILNFEILCSYHISPWIVPLTVWETSWSSNLSSFITLSLPFIHFFSCIKSCD